MIGVAVGGKIEFQRHKSGAGFRAVVRCAITLPGVQVWVQIYTWASGTATYIRRWGGVAIRRRARRSSASSRQEVPTLRYDDPAIPSGIVATRWIGAYYGKGLSISQALRWEMGAGRRRERASAVGVGPTRVANARVGLVYAAGCVRHASAFDAWTTPEVRWTRGRRRLRVLCASRARMSPRLRERAAAAARLRTYSEGILRRGAQPFALVVRRLAELSPAHRAELQEAARRYRLPLVEVW